MPKRRFQVSQLGKVTGGIKPISIGIRWFFNAIEIEKGKLKEAVIDCIELSIIMWIIPKLLLITSRLSANIMY